MKDVVKAAEFEAWEAEFDRRAAVWDTWIEEHTEVVS